MLVQTVVAINPPEKKPVNYKGNINLDGSLTSGNTDLKQVNFLGELVVRGEVLQLSLRGRWIYSEDSGSLITRNAFGTIKLDFFVTDQFGLAGDFGYHDLSSTPGISIDRRFRRLLHHVTAGNSHENHG